MPYADVNNDGIVNVFDLIAVAGAIKRNLLLQWGWILVLTQARIHCKLCIIVYVNATELMKEAAYGKANPWTDGA